MESSYADSPNPERFASEYANNNIENSESVEVDEEMFQSKAMANKSSDDSSCPPIRRILMYAAFPVIVALVGVFVYVLSISPAGVQNPFQVIDPPGQTKANPWRSYGRGLSLHVENACEDKYDDEFEEYIHAWNVTDALSLTSRKVAYDYNCSAVRGHLKVCNGNYGATDWRGLATNFIVSNFTIWSTAKLNDYFLASEGTISQRYTMCHEIGHGLGLPHTDENYWNAATGECMDYTLRPGKNLQPGQYNLNLLEELYGVPLVADDTSLPGDSDSNSRPIGIPRPRGEGLRRALRQNHKAVVVAENEELGSLVENSAIPECVMKETKEFQDEIEHGFTDGKHFFFSPCGDERFVVEISKLHALV